ncbi:MAG: UvrD-helicase domain-containing protein [bacterium]
MLTPSQEKALDLTKHSAVVANAGSGKTHVLVERYLKILSSDKNIHPRNIAAITFTDASARDLRQKISATIQKRLDEASEQADREHLLDLQRRLSGANISTIHAFCIQLLKTYPGEANVDASFAILPNPEDQLLREQCIQSTLYRILQTAYDEPESATAQLLPILRLLGRSKVTSLIHTFLNARLRTKNLIQSLYALPDDEILGCWDEYILEFLQNQIRGDVDLLFFRDLLTHTTANANNKTKAEEAILSFNSSNTPLELIKAYKALKETFFTQKSELRRNLFKDDEVNVAHQNQVQSFLSKYKQLENILYVVTSDDRPDPKIYLAYTRQLLRIHETALDEYTAQKNNYSVLDHDDVIERTLALVKIPEVRSELNNRFSHILIDEYQDTDASQYEIAKALSGDLKTNTILTVVGDPKQAIYSFRNADIELYRKTVEEIIATDPAHNPIPLSETFRMLPQVLSFINIVSEKLFTNTGAKSDIEFTSLIEARPDSVEGSVEIMIPTTEVSDSESAGESEENKSSKLDLSFEVEMIARKIGAIIGSQLERYQVLEKNVSRSVEYRDIAILLRERTHQSEIESALRRNNIPFIIYSGRGFYSQPEILDLLNYLRFLINTKDDLALAATLRSPYFTLNDLDLYRLAPEPGSVTSLWQRLSLNYGDDETGVLVHAYRRLSEDLQLVGRINTPQLLQRIIHDSGMMGILSAQSGSEQKIANIEKFTRLARGFGSEGYSGTFDFVERMSILSERDDMEAQAEQKQSGNSVHLMTIHNAKGLEFPIVFLPYLHNKQVSPRADSVSVILDKELGVGLKLPNQDPNHAVFELIKIRNKQTELAEAKRLFYVAMTRARDHLILSASNIKDYSKSKLGWVLDPLSTNTISAEVPNEIIYPTTITRYSEAGGYVSSTIDVVIPVIRELEALPLQVHKDIESEGDTEQQFLLRDIAPSESVGRYSPSQILTYLECPTKYFLRYQLGLPEESRLPYFNEADVQAEHVHGSVFGQLLHKLMERASQFYSEGIFDKSAFDVLFAETYQAMHLPKSLEVEYKRKILEDTSTILRSPVAIKSLQATHAQTEFPLRSKLASGQILSGIIDRLFKDDDGIWNILDYKTDRFENIGKKKRYEFQMKFYAYLVGAQHNSPTVKAHILYTHTGKSIEFIFEKKDFLEMESQLKKLVSEILDLKGASSLGEIKRELSHCSECPYFETEEQMCYAGLGDPSLKLLSLFESD